MSMYLIVDWQPVRSAVIDNGQIDRACLRCGRTLHGAQRDPIRRRPLRDGTALRMAGSALVGAGEAQGKTVVVVAVDGVATGLIAVRDERADGRRRRNPRTARPGGAVGHADWRQSSDRARHCAPSSTRGDPGGAVAAVISGSGSAPGLYLTPPGWRRSPPNAGRGHGRRKENEWAALKPWQARRLASISISADV
jgi:hypothetical protein